MKRFFTWLSSLWFTLLVPADGPLNTIDAREQMRKRQLLSVVLLMGIVTWTFFIFVIFFTGVGEVAQQSTNISIVSFLLCILWINRCGHLKWACVFYLISQFSAISITICILSANLPFTSFFSWSMFLIISTAAGLFLPAWASLFLAFLADGFMYWFMLYGNKSQFVAFIPDPTIRTALLIVILVLIFYTSLLGTISTVTTQKAIIKADRAMELEKTNQALTRAYADLEVAHAVIQRQALTDALTGLLNHRAVVEQLSKEIQQAHCSLHTFSLLFFDVDHFKYINDTYGHATGDIVLHSIAIRVSSVLRVGDTIGRFGGEEFVILLPKTDTAEARIIAERICLAVSSKVITTSEAATGITATISIGLATYPEDGELEQVLLAQADQAMYVAKRLGRNQVRMAMEVRQMSTDTTMMTFLQQAENREIAPL